MNKIKIIDLLNMISKGEEVPKKIRVHYRVFEKYLNHNAYLNTEDEENYKYLTDLPRLFDDDRDWLNTEVEILEEEKKIPKKLYKYMEKEEEGCYENILRVYDGGEYGINEDMSFVIDKINEIIDYLQSKGE